MCVFGGGGGGGGEVGGGLWGFAFPPFISKYFLKQVLITMFLFLSMTVGVVGNKKKLSKISRSSPIINDSV